jgi:hypothetical protein
MRFYRVVVQDKAGNVLIPNLNGQPGFTPIPYDPSLSTYSSLNAGMSQFDMFGTNPAALRVELDVALTAMDASLPSSYATITGVGLMEIAQSANLNGMQVSIYAGFAAGLPLANPAQAGLVAQGQIVDCYGNRTGSLQTLTIFVGAKLSSPSSSQTTGNPGTTLAPSNQFDAPANLVFQWKPGQPLLTPVTAMIQTAYPTYSIVGSVHEGLVWTGATATGFYSTLAQFATYIKQKSLSMISGYAPDKSQGSYPGVTMWAYGNTLYLADGTSQTTPKPIQYMELVGQPVWSGPNAVQVLCPMRADIKVGSYVTLPPSTPGITTQNAGSQYFNPPQAGNGGYADAQSGSIFTGTFQVVGVRLVGDSRDPGQASWVTAIDLRLAYLKPTTTGLASLPGVYTAPASTTNQYGFSATT